ncbi:DNA-3-methyladenine glycosylase family protein [Chryseosolibacter indicus]|uniref:DNA-3-methyladenine glycosylase II n=1 Tax=Chryseosolibacter indicus TaxID=2782351 RepID=A0ABS5VPN6_9BACT|nr:DNA-3-methyladenine glycosylase [Chryseosolibacter indicus]MBT1702757.1 DNA-3-methyladenine glycosylase [Chryseosolibacter indicus]
MSKMQLSLPEEFDFNLNLEFLKRSPRELLHQVENDTVLKALKFNDEKMLCRIRCSGKTLIVEFLNGEPTSSAKDWIRAYVQEWFDLETDLKPFYALAAKDKLLQPLVDKFYGYRIMGQPDLFESLVWAVLGQQINLQFAYTLKARFVEKFGERLFWNNESFYLFPTAKLVTTLNDDVLLPLQFSRQKSKYTITIAEAFASGEISKEKLAGLPLVEAKEQLIKIKGVGNWTANYALMKTFRYPDAFPLEDAGIHNAIKNLKKMDRKPTLDEVKKIFKKYKGWEAYATLYLWKSL